MKILQKICRRKGYDIAPWGWSADRVRKNFNKINTIFDVGVGFGTGQLYRAFPSAYLVLIEPLAEIYQSSINRILEKHKGEFLPVAIGKKDSKTEIHIDQSNVQKSTMHRRTELTKGGGKSSVQTVKVLSLDSIIHSKSFEPPFGLKIDTEGNELEVIEGATEFLKKTEFVIAEATIAKRFENSYKFDEIVQRLAEKGFHVSDVLNVKYKASIRRSLYADLFFERTVC